MPLWFSHQFLLPAGLTVALLLLLMISAATACKVNDVFCFENCGTSNVTQFCNCVVDEVVARNDSGSLSNATLLQEFENETALILQKNLGCAWCCTFIIIRQFVPQGNKVLTSYKASRISLLLLSCSNTSGTVYIVQFHCTKINAAMQPVVITKYWSYTRLLVPFRK